MIIFEAFFVQTHKRLEEVMVQPELVKELVEQTDVSHRVETVVTDIGADLGEVVFFDKAIVVFVIRARAAELQGLGGTCLAFRDRRYGQVPWRR